MKYFFSIFVLFITCPTGYGQGLASMSATPNEIGKNEYFTLQISATGMDGVIDFIPPLLEKFIVISGPIHESSSTRINGKTTLSTGISFLIKPKYSGKFDIGPAIIRLKSGQVKTNKVTITVTDSPGSGIPPSPFNNYSGADLFNEPQPQIAYSDMVLKKGEDVIQKINRNMELRLQTNKPSCYVGEPVVAEYKLYSRLRSDSRLTRTPSFNGFSVMDIPDLKPDDFKTEKINGREYNVYTIRKAQLYPLQPGTFTLDPAEVENNIQFIKEKYLKQAKKQGNILDDPSLALPPDAFVNQQLVLRSKPAIIHVKALPDSNKPPDFSGAVGNFSITSQLEKNSFGINETGKLMITISGEGNLQLLTAPKISWPNDAEAFDPTIKSNIFHNTVPLSGSKIFIFPFSSNRQGNYILPSISFSFFNPQKEKYQTIYTVPLPFKIEKAVTTPSTNQANNKHNEPRGINKIFYHRWWIIAGFALIALTGLLFWILKVGLKPERKESTNAVNEPETPTTTIPEEINFLSGAKSCINSENTTGFYTLLLSEYKQFLSYQFQIPILFINSQNIKVALEGKEVLADDINQVESLLKEIEACAYMPFEKGEKAGWLFSKTKSNIEKLCGRNPIIR